jgi:hypothetical protein
MTWTTLTLRRRHIIASRARHCLTDGESERLESALCAVVVIVTAQAVDVQRDACGHGKRVEDVRDHFAAEFADLLALEAELGDAVGPRGNVDHGARESLIQRGMASAIPADTAHGTEGGLEGLAERQGTVFRRVVVVDVQVAGAREGERHAAVLGERMQHLDMAGQHAAAR